MDKSIDALMARAAEKTVVPLWPSDAPGIDTDSVEREVDAGKYAEIRNPGLTIYEPRPEIQNGGAVVICPGGGYGMVSCVNEGYPIAEWLNTLGFKAYVLKYRLPNTDDGIYRHPIPLKDVQRAVRMVRASARDEGRAPDKVGIIGFSAGGHLAASALTQFAAPVDADPVSCRPDFGLLVYPVISLRDEALCNKGSRESLLGPGAGRDQWEAQSPELNVSSGTPPTFLVHARKDGSVPFGNSVVMYQALHAAGVSAELHLYHDGGHGFGLGLPMDDCSEWPSVALEWLIKMGMTQSAG